MQIAIEVLASGRPRRTVTELTQTYTVSRQTVYDIAAKGRQVLLAGLQPGTHGPHWQDQKIKVDRNRLVRGSMVLTEAGVSQRDMSCVWVSCWIPNPRWAGSTVS